MSPDLALLLLVVTVVADLVLRIWHTVRPGAKSVLM